MIMTKRLVGREKGLFNFHFDFVVQPQRKSGQEFQQGRNLESGADAEAMEGLLLTGLFSMACSARFLIGPRTTNPEMVPPTMGEGLSN